MTAQAFGHKVNEKQFNIPVNNTGRLDSFGWRRHRGTRSRVSGWFTWLQGLQRAQAESQVRVADKKGTC